MDNKQLAEVAKILGVSEDSISAMDDEIKNSMISKALAHDSDHDDHYCEILRRMGARDERVKAALIGNITSGDFVEINKNDYQDIIYILLENIDFYDNNGRLIYE